VFSAVYAVSPVTGRASSL